MTFTYTLGPRRRLVLGPPQAPTRLCMPIPREVYDALVAMPEQEQPHIVWTLGEVLTHLLAGTWEEPEPEPLDRSPGQARPTAESEEPPCPL